MCNCENKRNELQQESKLLSGKVYTSHHNNRRSDISFEYTGKTALSVTGIITGRQYRFNHRGDVQLIDYRDANGMKGILTLKKMDAGMSH